MEQPTDSMLSAVMRKLGKASAAKRQSGKTPEQVSKYYSKLRKGKKKIVLHRAK